MVPSIWPGDTLIVTKLNPCEIALGDIGLYQRDGRLFIHRVIAIDGGGIGEVVLKGDSMTEADPAIPSRDVLGRVQFIVRNGQKVEPRRVLHPGHRAIATLVQRSSIGTRIVFKMRQAYLTLNSLSNRID